MYTTNNRCLAKTWKEREDLILKACKPLVIKEFTLTEFDDNLEDFIHNFLARYNAKYETTTLDDLTGKQCDKGRLRSLIDIFLICKYYFPQCTLEEVKIALYNNDDILSSQVCGTVHRRVYWISLGSKGIHNHLTNQDELGLTINEIKNN